MCGVSAIISFDKSLQTEMIIRDMVRFQAHRGPDGDGIWLSCDGKVALGHNRLAIIEPTENGAQPWSQSDSEPVLVWNGEIYNHSEIREELISIGYKFKTRTDSEVILSAYAAWGVGAFNKFSGMWAIIIFDQSQKKLIVSRDRFGIKPLYFAIRDRALILASEQKAIRLLSPDLNKVNLQMLEGFYSAASVIKENETFFENIFRFPPATFVEYSLVDRQKSFDFHRYWSVPNIFGLPANQSDSPDILSKLTLSIRKHLVSDVKIACALSGGLDSSAISSIVHREQIMNGETLTTYTVGWPNDLDIDESRWAKELIASLHIKGITVTVSDKDMRDALDEILYYQDEPFASSSIISQYFLYQQVSKDNFKVVVDGQGADELFLGYQSIIPLFLSESFARGDYARTGVDIWNLFKRRREYRGSYTLNILRTCRLIFWSSLKIRRRKMEFSPLRDTQLDLLFDGNLESLLRYQDRNSMRWGVESRVPFLDHNLVEAVLELDPLTNWGDGFTKSVLRNSLHNVVPEKLLKRRDKLGYSTPEKRWMKYLGVHIDGNPEDHLSWRRFIGSKWLNNIEEGGTCDYRI